MNKKKTSEEQTRPIVVALAGNPNAGKTSLFNKLTRLRAHVGNYPGVTVEQKWGQLIHHGRTIKVVDLPGIYSLNYYSLDERVARDFILKEHPDLVINVVDSTNLKRNLYLTLQILEMGLPTIVALNMIDMAETSGLKIDIPRLEEGLKARVLPIAATIGRGLDNLLNLIPEVADRSDRAWKPIEISYGQDIDEALDRITTELNSSTIAQTKIPARWLAVKFLESDLMVDNQLQKEAPALWTALNPIRNQLTSHLKTTTDDEPTAVMINRRYGFLAGLKRLAITETHKDTRPVSDALDQILLNRLLAPLFFLAVIYVLYQFTFWASGPVVGWLENFFTLLSELTKNHLPNGRLKDLILEGIINGVGGVLGFTPLIAFMFVGISFLEDSGYMARVTFILDRIFRAFGLHGNSVMALIVGGGIAGGCAIPGVMATRTLRDPKERITTILVTPMMTCGAKLPVFLMLTEAFFPNHQAQIMMGLTVFAWIMALFSAKLLRLFVLHGPPTPFILELPPYRLPTLSGILLHAWERTWGYVKKAGTVIVAVTIILWTMMTFPNLPFQTQSDFDTRLKVANTEKARQDIESELKVAQLQNSLAGRIGTALEPLSLLAGFEWRTNIALVGGFAAKEVILTTMGTAYAMSTSSDPILAEATTPDGKSSTTKAKENKEVEEETLIHNLGHALNQNPTWSPLVTVSLLIFILIYAPCFATIAVIYKEIGLKWAAFSVVANTIYGYIICLIIYQGGLALGF